MLILHCTHIPPCLHVPNTGSVIARAVQIRSHLHQELNSLFPKKWLQWETGFKPFPSPACIQPCSSHFKLGVSLLSKLIYLGICSKQTLSWIIYRVRIPHIPRRAAFMWKEKPHCPSRGGNSGTTSSSSPCPSPTPPAPSKSQVLRTAGGPPRACVRSPSVPRLLP